MGLDNENGRSRLCLVGNLPVVMFTTFYAYSAKAAAVGMFLRFLRLGVLAFEIGERHESIGSQPD